MKISSFLCCVVVLGSAPAGASSYCFEQAVATYSVNVDLLRAVAQVESGLNRNARHVNMDGSEDLGVMQINSRWLRTLAKYRLTREHLLDACTNIHIGAWILANKASKMGWTWYSVGAYNARDPAKRAR